MRTLHQRFQNGKESMLLVPQETIVSMTGMNQPAAQLRRLKKLGLPAWVNARNQVCLTVAALQAWSGPRENPADDRPKLRQVRSG